jgi:hypothetical protein
MRSRDRGKIFGTKGPTMGKQVLKSQNPYRAMSNMPTQFGRSTKTSALPIFGQRSRAIRRR